MLPSIDLKDPGKREFLLVWIIANFASGILLGIAAPGKANIWMLLMGLLLGIGSAYVQGIILRKYIARIIPWHWVFMSVLGTLAVLFILFALVMTGVGLVRGSFQGISTATALSGFAGFAGFVFGLALAIVVALVQWRLLQPYFLKSGLRIWLAANLASALISGILTLVFGRPSGLIEVTKSVLSSAIYGVITGLALLIMHQYHGRQAEVPNKVAPRAITNYERRKAR